MLLGCCFLNFIIVFRFLCVMSPCYNDGNEMHNNHTGRGVKWIITIRKEHFNKSVYWEFVYFTSLKWSNLEGMLIRCVPASDWNENLKLKTPLHRNSIRKLWETHNSNKKKKTTENFFHFRNMLKMLKTVYTATIIG